MGEEPFLVREEEIEDGLVGLQLLVNLFGGVVPNEDLVLQLETLVVFGNHGKDVGLEIGKDDSSTHLVGQSHMFEQLQLLVIEDVDGEAVVGGNCEPISLLVSEYAANEMELGDVLERLIHLGEVRGGLEQIN